jgi:hypothetical protein
MPLSGWKTYCRVFTSGAALSITDVRWSHRRPARDEATNRMIRSSTRRKQDAKRYLRAGVKTGQFGLPGSGSPRVTDTRICRPFLIRRRCGTRLFFSLGFYISIGCLVALLRPVFPADHGCEYVLSAAAGRSVGTRSKRYTQKTNRPSNGGRSDLFTL